MPASSLHPPLCPFSFYLYFFLIFPFLPALEFLLAFLFCPFLSSSSSFRLCSQVAARTRTMAVSCASSYAREVWLPPAHPCHTSRAPLKKINPSFNFLCHNNSPLPFSLHPPTLSLSLHTTFLQYNFSGLLRAASDRRKLVFSFITTGYSPWTSSSLSSCWRRFCSVNNPSLRTTTSQGSNTNMPTS